MDWRDNHSALQTQIAPCQPILRSILGMINVCIGKVNCFIGKPVDRYIGQLSPLYLSTCLFAHLHVLLEPCNSEHILAQLELRG